MRCRSIALLLAGLLVIPLPGSSLAADPTRQLLNDGQVVLEGAPPIPPSLAEELGQFQDTRTSLFADFMGAGDDVLIRTRFEGVNQLYRVEAPGGERRRLTTTREAIGEVERRPGAEQVAFTMSDGGDGFDQIYLLDPAVGKSRLLTDGQSLNNRMVWDATGKRLAWRSTRRNGRHNDIWLMEADDPGTARMVLEAPDGALWKPVSFSRDGQLLLIQYYAGITDSRIYLLDLAAGSYRLLAGGLEAPSANIATGFDHEDTGVHFITNRRDGAAEIGWLPLDGSEEVAYMPEKLIWDVTEFELSREGKRGAFVTNEEGVSRLYLFDPRKQRYRRVENTPMGSISGLKYSANGRRLGMTISTPKTPSDVFILDLGLRTLGYRRLKRWTHGQIDGLDPEQFVEPKLAHFPAPMITADKTLMMPVFYYRPKGVKPPFPVIIQIHGGPEGQFRPVFNSTLQMWLDQLGVAVLAPNVRGSMGYGSAYLAMDDGRLRENAVRDIGALLDWISEHPDLDENRVAVYGASYGGYMALASAVHFGERLRAAVDRAGISNFVTYLENTQGYRRDLRRAEYGDERDPDMRAFLQSISPLNNVERISTPMFIAQGKNDPVVPESESEQMVRALRAHGQTVWYMNALNEGHNYQRKENRDLFEQVTFLFLTHYLLEEQRQEQAKALHQASEQQ